ncbi:outer spore coat protein CotE [Alicyclobacillus tolerans]|uniref:Spore coat protein E n=2 Tax=Alicyclobacillus tolerans TaxID=90970 RepID=A0A1M6X5X3_9BACL|nr:MULTISPECIES: outer spore coat protein CotE [Alicyclobacillus]MDP9728922.1 spore coat protein E [Alicyclobacillus tengchongensis]QRF23654.1 outer spore coat protein CotE [Alicyclobacillus sp. TC]SHL01321.1 spore coat protein E [Alicyclobacillus montanus]
MVLSRDDLSYREIVASAVCGRGSKYSQTTYTLHPANRPTTIGGCWVMNHTYDAMLVGDYVEVHGRFDVNVWYSYNNNSETAVAKDTVSYVEQIALRDLDADCVKDTREVEVRVLQSPNCLDATVTGNGSEILVRVEKELGVEVVGKTKLAVVTYNVPSKKDDEFYSDSNSILEEVEIED